MTHLLPYIIENLEYFKLKHEINRFDSGAIMVDIWINDKLHVVQIDDESIGLSLVTENTALFDIIPDVSFSEEKQFKIEFQKILPHESVKKKTKLISLIELFEKGEIDFKNLQFSVTELTGNTISLEEVESYWKYTSLNNFCETFLVESIIDWQDIDDEKAILLIREVLENVTNDGILKKNSEALEKRYRKPDGFLLGLVFGSEIDSPDEILQQLKKDTTIYL